MIHIRITFNISKAILLNLDVFVISVLLGAVFESLQEVDLVFERDERLSSYLLRPLREEGTTIVVCVRKQVPLPPTALPILPV